MLLPILLFFFLLLRNRTRKYYQLQEGGSIELGAVLVFLPFFGFISRFIFVLIFIGLGVKHGNDGERFVKVGLVVHTLDKVAELVNGTVVVRQ